MALWSLSDGDASAVPRHEPAVLVESRVHAQRKQPAPAKDAGAAASTLDAQPSDLDRR
jgi:hypothetical protein